MRSCAVRDRPRTRRPITMIATSTTGTLSRAIAVSFGLVTAIMTSAPSAMTMLRSANEAEEPITVCTSVVSALMRESSSPVRTRSKNSVDSDSTWLNTLLRTSATTRSPIQVTR